MYVCMHLSFVVQGIELRALFMLNRYTITDLYLQPNTKWFLIPNTPKILSFFYKIFSLCISQLLLSEPEIVRFS
jgi:hypothetical protein